MGMRAPTKLLLTGRATEILSQLAEVRNSDLKAERWVNVGSCGSVIGFLAFFFSAWQILEGNLDDPLLLTAGLGGTVTVIGIAMWFFAAKYDLENTRQEALNKVVTFLAADCSPKTNFVVELDFRGSCSQPFFVREDPPETRDEPESVTKQITKSHYRQELLTLETTLLDGSRVSCTWIRESQSRKIEKRAPGRTKWYTRYSHRDTIEFRCRLSQRHYGDPADLLKRLQASAPGTGVVSKLQQRGPWIRLAVKYPRNARGVVSAELMLEPLIWLFREARQLKSESVRQQI
jgi:hypothetical protein